jgi:hypothetical protein
MEGWMYARRVPAVHKYKADTSPSATKEQFNANLPPEVRWKADNYNHLFEQPTQFYAVALTMALLGVDNKLDVGLAWAYVGIRVGHSFVQSCGNNIMRRFSLYIVCSSVLAAMTVRAGLVLLDM